jgi:hypothetical protein
LSCCEAVSPGGLWLVDVVVSATVVEETGIVVLAVEPKKTPTKRFASNILRLAQQIRKSMTTRSRGQHCESEMASLVSLAMAAVAVLFKYSALQITFNV